MVNAFAASGIVAVLAGIVGYFLVLRGQTFAGHALSHVGFTGATGAVLVGVSPLWGMIGFTLAAGIGMGALGERLSGRDVAIGVILSLSLGFGLLFLHFFTAYATQATALLFGNVLGVSHETLVVLAGLAAVSLVALAAIMRPLLFASLAAGTGRGEGGVAALRVGAVSRDYGACSGGLHADRRRVAGVRVDGRAGGGRAERDDAALDRAGARCGVRLGAGVGRVDARVTTPTGRRASGSRCSRRWSMAGVWSHGGELRWRLGVGVGVGVELECLHRLMRVGFYGTCFVLVVYLLCPCPGRDSLSLLLQRK